MKKTHRPLTVVALLAGIFMGAMEMTVVSTAMPTVIGDLGGIHLYAWVFAAYMLASTVTVPLYGKLADLYGRKPVMLFGLALFLAGSVLSGQAHGMTWLIASRAVQGLGAGAMGPTSLTIIGDIFTLEERAKMQGVFGAVWGVAGLAGPLVGSVITTYLSWRWIFYINVPFGLVSGVLLTLFLHEKVERRAHTLDLAGAGVLTLALVAMLASARGGAMLAVGLPAAALLSAAFIAIERRAKEPVLPLELFRIRLIAVASVAGALVGAAMIATTTYVPLFIQGVLGASQMAAASAITPMVIGWPIASAISGRLLPSTGARVLVRAGLALSALSSLGLAVFLRGDVGGVSPLTAARIGTFCFGAGLGFANTALLITVQSAVHWKQRGVATASTMFFRTIGGTLAVGLLGGVIARALAGVPGVPDGAADALLGPEHGRNLDPALVHSLGHALEGSLGAVFWSIAVIAAGAFVASAFFPRDAARAALGPVEVTPEA